MSKNIYDDMHPCRCKSYNGCQCYNCLNGAHDICDGEPKCQQPRDKVLGLPIVIGVSRRGCGTRTLAVKKGVVKS